MQLSVITVNLNNAEGLQKTIDSVYTQTWKGFEYIIIDGGSSDGSKELIDKIAASKKLTHWVSEPDNGVYQAMNKGIKLAKGEFLLFLNSGDFFVNENVLFHIFNGKNYVEDILCGKCNVSDNGNVVWTTNPPDEITFGFLYNVGLAHQSTFIKRELFDKFGLYREDFYYNSDIDFWYKSIILGVCTTKALGEIVTDYNLDGISSKQKDSERFIQEHEEILSNKIYKKFIPDYEDWKKERNEMAVYYWAKSKKIVDLFIQTLFRISTFIAGK